MLVAQGQELAVSLDESFELALDRRDRPAIPSVIRGDIDIDRHGDVIVVLYYNSGSIRQCALFCTR